jgi:Fic family protein
MTRTDTKTRNLARVKQLLIQADENGLMPVELQRVLGVSRSTIGRYLKEVGAKEVRPGAERYTYIPTPEEIELARLIVQRAEGGETK